MNVMRQLPLQYVAFLEYTEEDEAIIRKSLEELTIDRVLNITTCQNLLIPSKDLRPQKT